MGLTVDLDELPLADAIGKGGFAHVVSLEGYHVDNEHGPFAFKRYRPQVLAAYGPGIGVSVHALMRLRDELQDPTRRRLDGRTIWPLQSVSDGGRVVGLVMRRIPDRFFFDMRLTRTVERRLRQVQLYFCHPSRSADNGVEELTAEARLMVVARFASQLSFLHGIGVVVGDIQGGNVAVDPGDGSAGSVRIMMYDSDSYRTSRSRPAIPQAHAFSWDPPEIRSYRRQAENAPPGSIESQEWSAKAGVQTRETDVYKFGLLVVRLLAMENQTSTTEDPTVVRSKLANPRLLGPTRTRTILSTLEVDPGNRPLMSEIVRSLATR
ncbi:hypothetical protein ACWEKT_02130 [Nocardia takedensis]